MWALLFKDTMIKPFTRLVNKLLAAIYFDKNDATTIRVAFDLCVKILAEHDIFVAPIQYETVLRKVLDAKLVGKIPTNDVAKWAIAETMLNTALAIALSKEELIKLQDPSYTTERFHKPTQNK